METNATNPAQVQNFNIWTDLGTLFTQTVKSDVSRLVGLLGMSGVQVKDISSADELPDLDDQVTVKLDVSSKEGIEYDFSLEVVAFMSDRVKAAELALKLSKNLEIPVTTSIEGEFLTTWIDGHLMFSMVLKP
jgi:hypothetical protein